MLSKEGIAGEILVILDDPLTINTNSGFLTLSVDISSVLDDFKPSLQLEVEDGELRSVNEASFRMFVPQRNILDLMKARNALLTLGLPEKTIQQLDEISLK